MTRRSATYLAWAAVTLGFLAAWLPAYLSGGLPGRFPGYAPPDLAAVRAAYREGTCFLRQEQTIADWHGIEDIEGCLLAVAPPAAAAGTGAGRRHDARRRLLLWGDSFAAHLLPGLAALAPSRGAEVLQLTASACPPLPSAAARALPRLCREVSATAEALLAGGTIDQVIVAGRWDRYDGEVPVSAIAAAVDRIERAGAEAVVVGRSPILTTADPYHFSYMRPGTPIPLRPATPLERAVDALTGVAVPKPLDALCGGGETCLPTAGGALVFSDEGHLTVHGSRLLVARIADALIPRTAATTIEATTPAPGSTPADGAAPTASMRGHARDRPIPLARQAGTSDSI